MACRHFAVLAAGLLGVAAATPDGKQLYQLHCASCHGPQGNGDGPAAVYLYPKPRDFTRGLFKVRSTPDGEMPTDEDLLNTITRGMPGSPMPAFAFLNESDRKALVQHVKSLVPEPLRTPAQPISVGAEPPVSPATLAAGKELYAKMECGKCHGPLGKGDGPSAATLKDSWGYPIKVRDFTTGQYLGGPSNRDLYLRFTTGMSGTPMPSYQQSLTDEQRWALVHYVQSLRVPGFKEFIPPKNNLITATRLRGRLDEHTLAATTAYEIPVMVLWPRPNPLHGIYVRTAHNGKQIAFLLEWDAPQPSHANVGQLQFRDSAAVQFSMTGAYSFLGMGDKDNPVNIWHWKSDWQTELAGTREDIDTAHPAMHVDYYDRAEPIFITARAAGNLFAADKRTSPVEDLNATGFGTLEPQPPPQQNVTGNGVWRDGKWRVLFLRDLTTQEAGDQQFKPGATVPVSFAVWAGEHGDRNGQKAVSTWFNLTLQK
jgi:mono/diheme cytochrome c family protein